MSKFGNGNNDNRIVRNDPTRLIRKKSQSETVKVSRDAPTKKIDAHSDKPASDASASMPKTPASEESSKGAPEFMNLDPGKTRVFKPKKEQSEEPASRSSDNPVVGWLVVTEGAGLGNAIEFSYGRQGIGRDVSQGICLNFGDEQVSREGHAFIEYDPRESKAYLSKGANLVYHNGDRVGQGAETTLTTGDTIELGDTKLRYVAFCGADFCWTKT